MCKINILKLNGLIWCFLSSEFTLVIDHTSVTILAVKRLSLSCPTCRSGIIFLTSCHIDKILSYRVFFYLYPFCVYFFSQSHRRQHNKDKPFKCHNCNRGYTDAASLEVHLSTHTVKHAKLFSCGLCNRSYTSVRFQMGGLYNDLKIWLIWLYISRYFLEILYGDLSVWAMSQGGFSSFLELHNISNCNHKGVFGSSIHYSMSLCKSSSIDLLSSVICSSIIYQPISPDEFLPSVFQFVVFWVSIFETW